MKACEYDHKARGLISAAQKNLFAAFKLSSRPLSIHEIALAISKLAQAQQELHKATWQAEK